MDREKQLFAQGLKALKDKNYKEAEKKLKEFIEKGKEAKEKKKAEIIYNSLLIRKECDRLLSKVESD